METIKRWVFAMIRRRRAIRNVISLNF